jgi:hypothetical protein
MKGVFLMDKDFLNERLSYFGNIYAIFPILVLQVPFLIGWVEVDSIEQILALNSLMFIFTGLLFSSVVYSWTGFKNKDFEKEVEARIWFFKKHQILVKATDFIMNSFEGKALTEQTIGVKGVWKSCYNRTTHTYWNKIMRMKDPTKMSAWEIIKTLLLSFGVTFFTLYLPYSSWYVVLSMLITMAMAGIYGYKVGMSVYANRKIIPSKLLVLLCDDFIRVEGLKYSSLDFSETNELLFYDIYNDKIIV